MHQLSLAVDDVSDAVLLIVWHHPVTTIVKSFGRVAHGHEHRGTEDLRVSRKPKLGRSADGLADGWPEKQHDKRKEAFAHTQSISSGRDRSAPDAKRSSVRVSYQQDITTA
jgi:hypothetical protein